MKVMSSRLVRQIVLGGLLFGVALTARMAYADVQSLENMLNAGIAPSAAPALLGPISEAGRKGWKCLPERAAAAPNARSAELPNVNDVP